MAVIEELIRLESDGSLSFGNYLMDTKKKVLDFEAQGDLYKVKTFKEITKLEKNGNLLFETVPGATVHSLSVNEKNVSFMLEGFEDTQVTMELEPDTVYRVLIDGTNVGSLKTNMSGKVNFSVELKGKAVAVDINKI